MSDSSNNFKKLEKWAGPIPKHGEHTDVARIRLAACSLLSHRTVSEVEGMLGALNEQVEGVGAGEWDYELPPAVFNWQLHGTVLWRVITTIPHDLIAASRKLEPWEYVAAIALHATQRAVAALSSEPIGLGVLPITVSARSQKLIASASQWLQWAEKEQVAKAINIGRRVKAGARKGSQSRHKGDNKAERRFIILNEAKEIQQKNPKLTTSAIAGMIARNHAAKSAEPGYGQRTVYEVLKEAEEK